MPDPGRVPLRCALRVAITLPLAYVFTMFVLKIPAGAAYTAFGTFVLPAMADFGGPTKERARAYLLTGVAGLVTIAPLTAGKGCSTTRTTSEAYQCPRRSR